MSKIKFQQEFINYFIRLVIDFRKHAFQIIVQIVVRNRFFFQYAKDRVEIVRREDFASTSHIYPFAVLLIRLSNVPAFQELL